MPTETPSTFLTLAREIVAGQQALRDQTITGGVSWSAMSRPAPQVETVDEVAARLEHKHADHLSFKASPRGRFCDVVNQLAEIGCYGEEVYKLRSLYNSRITALNGPVADPAAVGAAVLILTGVGTKLATAGVEALAELLVLETSAQAKAA